ncbi:MAG: DNA polymerase III subunit delta [Eubacteriales bacterium]|nr:DNA polymerase III subunit delta [Eubacteriales bacterium]
MKNINKDIETKQMKQFYLLFGSEDYLKGQYKKKIATALVPEEDNMNYNYYEGSGINVRDVLETGVTLPFFADCRVIVLENSGWFKKCPEELDEQLKTLPDTTYIIFVEKDVDKRNRLYKWIGKNGYAAEMSTPDEKMLLTWVNGLCKAEGKQIADEAIYYLVEHMGTDMMLLKNEMEKLFSYAQQKDIITVQDVREVCVGQATDKMFDMLDAIGSGNQKKALSLYHDLLALREPAMRVLYMLTRHFHILMQISALVRDGKDNKTIAGACGIPPFSVKKYAAQASQYSYAKLKEMVEKCQQIDQGIKTGTVGDVVGVELLIVEFSEKK